MESSNGNRTRDILIGLVVVIIIILIAIFIIRRRQTPAITTNNLPFPTPVSSFEQNLQNNFGITVPSTAIKANLNDVTASNQTGLATSDKEGNQNVYTVIANLNDPTPGYFYQAWLVNGNDYIPLGKLDIAKGGWIVNYTSARDLSDHKAVWVTLEKTNDPTPEKHVLEGSF